MLKSTSSKLICEEKERFSVNQTFLNLTPMIFVLQQQKRKILQSSNTRKLAKIPPKHTSAYQLVEVGTRQKDVILVNNNRNLEQENIILDT